MHPIGRYLDIHVREAGNAVQRLLDLALLSWLRGLAISNRRRSCYLTSRVHAGNGELVE